MSKKSSTFAPDFEYYGLKNGLKNGLNGGKDRIVSR
jgi:hypothetical protein